MKKLVICLLLGLFITKTQGESFLEVYHQGVNRYQKEFADDQEIAIQARQLKERLLTYSPKKLKELGLESSSSLSFMDAYKQLRTILSPKKPSEIKQDLLQYNLFEINEIIEAGGIEAKIEAKKETDPNMALITAAGRNKPHVIDYLIRKMKADIEAKDEYGFTALMQHIMARLKPSKPL